MNYLNDSGEFHDVESNYSGKTSHVPSQSMLSCDKRLPPEIWNPPGPQENVFANPRSTFESLQKPYHTFMTTNAAGEAPALISTWKLVARKEERIGSPIPMPTFARTPPTMSSCILVDIQKNSIVGQQRQQISELQFDKFPTPISFLCWKIRLRNQVTTCSDFHSEAMLWIKEDELKSSRSVAGKIFPNFEREDCFCSEQDHTEFPVQEEGQSRGTESSKRRSVSTRKTARLHDLRLLASDWRS